MPHAPTTGHLNTWVSDEAHKISSDHNRFGQQHCAKRVSGFVDCVPAWDPMLRHDYPTVQQHSPAALYRTQQHTQLSTA